MSASPSQPSEGGSRKASLHGGRSLARLAAVQALYQMELTGLSVEAVVEEFKTHRLRLTPDTIKARLDDDESGESEGEKNDLTGADPDYFSAIILGTVARQAEIDKRLHANLAPGWTLARLDATLRAVLRAGAYELMVQSGVPTAVIINEYVDLAHAFFGGEEPGVVNAMLDRLARDVRAKTP